MPTASIKQLAKFYNDEILKDTSLSMDSVIEVTAGKAEIAPETVKDALLGKAKLTNEVLVRIFEALGIDMQEDEDCPGGASRLPNGDCPPPQGEPQGNGRAEAQHPCGPGETPEKDGCIEESKKSTVNEQLEGTFGKDDLGNHFNEVLKLIKANKDVETGKYLSEIFRKVFETIPIIIKAEQGDKITEYTAKVDGLSKKLDKKEKEVKELQTKMKTIPKLTEVLEKVSKTRGGKGLYEQDGKTQKPKGTVNEMTLAEMQGGREVIPEFD